MTDFYDLEGKIINDEFSFEKKRLYENVLKESKYTLPIAEKSGIVHHSAAGQNVGREIIIAHGGNKEYTTGRATHSEIRAVNNLGDKVYPSYGLSTDAIAFYTDDAKVARICGFCRDGLRGTYAGNPIMNPKAVIIGGNIDEAVVVPWKEYIPDNWVDIIDCKEIDEVFNVQNSKRIEDALKNTRPVYTKEPLIGGYFKQGNLFLGSGLEYSTPERELGPISQANGAFIDYVENNNLENTAPEGFIFFSNNPVDVTFSMRQAVADSVRKMGYKDVAAFPIMRVSLEDSNVQIGTINDLLPFAYASVTKK